MSIRPPTLREKRRYLLARIDPAGTNPEAKDLYYAVYEAVVSLFGDMAAAAMQPSVLCGGRGKRDPALPQGCRTGVCHRALNTNDLPGYPGCPSYPCGLWNHREPAGADRSVLTAGNISCRAG